MVAVVGGAGGAGRAVVGACLAGGLVVAVARLAGAVVVVVLDVVVASPSIAFRFSSSFPSSLITAASSAVLLVAFSVMIRLALALMPEASRSVIVTQATRRTDPVTIAISCQRPPVELLLTASRSRSTDALSPSIRDLLSPDSSVFSVCAQLDRR